MSRMQTSDECDKGREITCEVSEEPPADNPHEWSDVELLLLACERDPQLVTHARQALVHVAHNLYSLSHIDYNS